MNNYWSEVIKRLDLNPDGVWLVYSVGAIIIPLSLFLKKHLTWKEWYITFGVVGFLAWLGNIVFFYQLDLLDSGKPSIGSLPDTIMFGFAPACASVVYCNFYVSSTAKRFLGTLFTLGSIIMEYSLVAIGFLVQKGWSTWYSIPIYLILYFIFLPRHIKFIRNAK